VDLVGRAQGVVGEDVHPQVAVALLVVLVVDYQAESLVIERHATVLKGLDSLMVTWKRGEGGKTHITEMQGLDYGVELADIQLPNLHHMLTGCGRGRLSSPGHDGTAWGMGVIGVGGF